MGGQYTDTHNIGSISVTRHEFPPLSRDVRSLFLPRWGGGGERGLISRTAADNRAYYNIPPTFCLQFLQGTTAELEKFVRGLRKPIRVTSCRFRVVASELSLPSCRFQVIASELSLPSCPFRVVPSELSLPSCRVRVVAAGHIATAK